LEPGGKTTVVQGANLALRFALELGAIAAVAWWGFGVSWVLGLLAPAAVIAVWWLFVAPKRRFELGHPLRFAVELCVWAAATVALFAAGQPFLAVAFGVAAVASGALNYAWEG
jgi:Protein of unknown function (DUF2568)